MCLKGTKFKFKYNQNVSNLIKSYKSLLFLPTIIALISQLNLLIPCNCKCLKGPTQSFHESPNSKAENPINESSPSPLR